MEALELKLDPLEKLVISLDAKSRGDAWQIFATWLDNITKDQTLKSELIHTVGDRVGALMHQAFANLESNPFGTAFFGNDARTPGHLLGRLGRQQDCLSAHLTKIANLPKLFPGRAFTFIPLLGELGSTGLQALEIVIFKRFSDWRGLDWGGYIRDALNKCDQEGRVRRKVGWLAPREIKKLGY